MDLKKKLNVFILVNIYFLLYWYIYLSYLSEFWEYFGFQYNTPNLENLIFFYLLTVTPILWLSDNINNLSSFMSWMIYYFIYIPIIITFLLISEESVNRQKLAFSIFLSFFLLSKFPSFSLNIKYYKLSSSQFWIFFSIFYSLLVIYIFLVFGSNLKISSLLEVYDQRASGGEIIGSSFVGYAISFLSGALNPFLMSYGLFFSKRTIYLLGALGQIFIYSTLAMKSVLLSLIIIPIFYFTTFMNSKNESMKIGTLIVLSLATPLLLDLFIYDSENINNIKSILYMRTYGMVGLLTNTYANFFETNQHTYFSHINIISVFINYPYDSFLGLVIGNFMGLDMNANANFFATDGIATGGEFGLICIGLIMGFTFKFFDNFIKKDYLPMSNVAFIPIVISLSNTSFFTTLLTGGFFILILFFYFLQCTAIKDNQYHS